MLFGIYSQIEHLATNRHLKHCKLPQDAAACTFRKMQLVVNEAPVATARCSCPGNRKMRLPIPAARCSGHSRSDWASRLNNLIT